MARPAKFNEAMGARLVIRAPRAAAGALDALAEALGVTRSEAARRALARGLVLEARDALHEQSSKRSVAFGT